jgi:hypothetical protein
VAMPAAYRHIGMTPPKRADGQPGLFDSQ